MTTHYNDGVMSGHPTVGLIGVTDDCENHDEEAPATPPTPYADATPAREPADGSLSLDTISSLLADAERRAILAYLHTIPEPTATVSELTDHLCQSSDVQVADETDCDHRTARLQHRQLPKLEVANVLEYDTRSGMIRYRDDPELHDWLDYIRNEKLKEE